MSLYTTGEIARICGVSVRTVQYYDTRGLLMPTELSEGGRRLYSEEDCNKMRVICYLKELGFSLGQIATLLKEEESEAVIETILSEQLYLLKEELADKQKQINKVKEVMQALKRSDTKLTETIGDIAIIMEHKKKLKKVYLTMILTAIPIFLLQVGVIVLGIVSGNWWPVLLYLAVTVPWAVLISRYYFKHTAYICPECHEIFKPSFKEVFFAYHTPKMRRLTCPACGHKGLCIEIYNGKENNNG